MHEITADVSPNVSSGVSYEVSPPRKTGLWKKIKKNKLVPKDKQKRSIKSRSVQFFKKAFGIRPKSSDAVDPVPKSIEIQKSHFFTSDIHFGRPPRQPSKKHSRQPSRQSVWPLKMESSSSKASLLSKWWSLWDSSLVCNVNSSLSCLSLYLLLMIELEISDVISHLARTTLLHIYYQNWDIWDSEKFSLNQLFYIFVLLINEVYIFYIT